MREKEKETSPMNAFLSLLSSQIWHLIEECYITGMIKSNFYLILLHSMKDTNNLSSAQDFCFPTCISFKVKRYQCREI